jgi:cobalt/nickel transport system permease protein
LKQSEPGLSPRYGSSPPTVGRTIYSSESKKVTPTQILDHYQLGDSVVHCLDARVKLILALATIVVIAALPRGSWLIYLACLAVICIAIGLSHIRPVLVFRRSLVAMPFTLAALGLLFTIPGSTLVSLGLAGWTLSVTAEGTVAFASILIKAWLSVLTATVLVATTPFAQLVAAMRAFRVPQILVSTVSFMYRYMYVIADEALRLHRAREARSAMSGSKAGGSISWRARVLGGMVGSLFLRSYERSERVYAAMLSRGFDGSTRTMRMPSLGRRDFAAMAAFVFYLLAVAMLMAFQRGR